MLVSALQYDLFMLRVASGVQQEQGPNNGALLLAVMATRVVQ